MAKVSIKPGRIFCPLPLYVIGTNNADGSPNFATITWMASNWNGTPHIYVGLGAARVARENVLREGIFTFNLVSRDMVWLADHLGSAIGHDKYDDVSYEIGRGTVVAAPLLEASKLIFECQVSQSYQMEGGMTFIGDIKNVLLDEALADMDMDKIDLQKLDPVIFAPHQYYGVGELLGPCDGWSDHIEELRKLARTN